MIDKEIQEQIQNTYRLFLQTIELNAIRFDIANICSASLIAALIASHTTPGNEEKKLEETIEYLRKQFHANMKKLGKT